GTRLLATHPRTGRTRPRRSRTRDAALGTAWRPGRDPGPRASLCRGGGRGAGGFPGRTRAAGPRRDRRLRDRARLLSRRGTIGDRVARALRPAHTARSGGGGCLRVV